MSLPSTVSRHHSSLSAVASAEGSSFFMVDPPLGSSVVVMSDLPDVKISALLSISLLESLAWLGADSSDCLATASPERFVEGSSMADTRPTLSSTADENLHVSLSRTREARALLADCLEPSFVLVAGSCAAETSDSLEEIQKRHD